jgi:hypothetical protein
MANRCEVPGNWPVEVNANQRAQASRVLTDALSKALAILTGGPTEAADGGA